MNLITENKFVSNVYGLRGDAILKDIADTRFTVCVEGRATENEEHCYGTWSHSSSFACAQGPTITAVTESINALVDVEWTDFFDDSDVISYFPSYFRVHDYTGELVLGGKYVGNKVVWFHLEKDGDKQNQIEEKISDLLSEAALEGAWDNYETARKLREEADCLSLSLCSSRVSRSNYFALEMDALKESYKLES